MTAPDTPAAVADRLEALRLDLAKLHADAELLRLPQSVVMGLYCLCEDADDTLAYLQKTIAEREAEREAERAVMAQREGDPPCSG